MYRIYYGPPPTYMIFFSASWWKVWSAWSDLERSTCTVTSLKITVWVCYNAYSGSELRVVSSSSLISVKVTCVALTESAPYASLWLIMPLGTICTRDFELYFIVSIRWFQTACTRKTLTRDNPEVSACESRSPFTAHICTLDHELFSWTSSYALFIFWRASFLFQFLLFLF